MAMKKRFQNLTTKVGMWILIVGTGPLLILVLLDFLRFPVSDNPIGLGLLFFFTAPIGMLVLLVGLLKHN